MLRDVSFCHITVFDMMACAWRIQQHLLSSSWGQLHKHQATLPVVEVQISQNKVLLKKFGGFLRKVCMIVDIEDNETASERLKTCKYTFPSNLKVQFTCNSYINTVYVVYERD